MAKKIPSEVKIGNRTVTVHREELMSDGMFGYYNQIDLSIHIDSSLNDEKAVETFWHELVHAIFDHIRLWHEIESEMADKDDPATDAFKIEETVTDNFAKTLLQVIQDNNLVV